MRSRSETRCEERITLSSCSATASIRSCRNSRRASGSRLATGSSRISSSGRFATPERERELRALAAGELARPAGRGSRPSRWMRCARQGVVPARVEVRAEAQVVGDAQAGVRRRVLRDVADLRPAARAGRGPPPSTSMVPAVGASMPDGEVEQRALAGAVRADEADDAAGRDLQRAVRRAPSAAGSVLPRPLGAQDRRSCDCSCCRGRERWSRKSASMLSSSRPASARLAPASARRSCRSGPCAASVVSVSVRGDERADARAGGDEPVVLELAIGLEHGVGVDGQLADDVLDRRELVALAQQAEPQRVPDLLDDLQVRREAGAAVEVELDHCARKLAQ